MNTQTFEVSYEYDNERMDKFLAVIFPELSRSFFQKLIKNGHIKVNESSIDKASYRLKTEDLVEVYIPDAVSTDRKSVV